MTDIYIISFTFQLHPYMLPTPFAIYSSIYTILEEENNR